MIRRTRAAPKEQKTHAAEYDQPDPSLNQKLLITSQKMTFRVL
jgi:hypothetical protein